MITDQQNCLHFVLLLIFSFFSSCKTDKGISQNFVKNYSEINSTGSIISEYDKWEYEEGAILPIQLYPIQKIEKIGEGGSAVYFSHVFSIISTPTSYLLSDDTGGKLVMSDKNFSLKKIIGKKGTGPGEFYQPRTSFLTGNKIWTSGTANRGFAIHSSEGQMITNFKPQLKNFNPVLTKFLVYNSQLYFSTPKENHPITILDDKGNKVAGFGSSYTKYATEEKQFDTRGHLIPFDQSSFLMVGESGPVIQRYTYDGKLLEEHVFVDHPYFKSFFEGVKQRREASKNPNMSFLLFQDIVVRSNQAIYLLTYDYDKEGQVSCQTILKMIRFKDHFFIDKIIKLSDTSPSTTLWYESITIDEENKLLLAYDYVSSSLHIFDIAGLLD